jgi:uncharacterized protein (TIGR03000 family)
MYSVVLMAALTTGGSAPDFLCHHGTHGYSGISSTCTGCYGGSYYGAPYGPGWGGYGGSYGGPGWGGYCGGSCGGCWGGYCGGSCGGCWGCYGGAWGYGGGIDYSCFGCHGCYGCYGGFGCTGFNPYGPNPSTPEMIPAPKPDEKKGGTTSVAPDRAKVIVQLPAGAKLYVDDQPIKTSTDNQAFNTPRLDRGQTYYYEVRAEVVRDGKTVVESKRVLVKAGEEVSVAFPKLEKDAGIAVVDPNKGR